MNHDLTIIFLTANKVPKQWAAFHKEKLLEAAGDAPIITISKEPLDWGKNMVAPRKLVLEALEERFATEDAQLAKIQIDNSVSLGWQREDILLALDFPWKYNGVKSVVVPDGLYYDFDKNANKALVLVYLFNQGMIEPQELYWCHDFDAYELNRIHEAQLGLDHVDAGFVHYFYKPEWCFSNFFFKSGAKDILELIDQTIRHRPWKSRNNEKTLTWLIKHHTIDPKRYKKLNVTYNIAKRSLRAVYNEAEKPLKVLHFRPSDPKDARMPDSALNMFMYGKNNLKVPLMNERLIKIFKYHRIR